jgi:hypothetical protein
MDWKDMGNVVAKLAPSIAAVLGGPLAGGAVAALEGVFGIKTDGTTEDKQTALVAAISGATPEQLLAIKKADQDYAVQMQTLGFKNVEALAALTMSDRDSARKREMDVKDNTPKILAYAITVGFFSILVFMLFATVPAGSRDILNVMLGTFGTGWAGVISYYFGSSVGSAEKTKLLSQADAIKQ